MESELEELVEGKNPQEKSEDSLPEGVEENSLEGQNRAVRECAEGGGELEEVEPDPDVLAAEWLGALLEVHQSRLISVQLNNVPEIGDRESEGKDDPEQVQLRELNDELKVLINRTVDVSVLAEGLLLALVRGGWTKKIKLFNYHASN